MLKIYADVLQFNFIYQKNNYEILFINHYIQSRLTFILFESDSELYTIYNNNNTNQYIRGSEIFNEIKIKCKSGLNTHKLDYIQNLARMNNINTKKPGKHKSINKTNN